MKIDRHIKVSSKKDFLNALNSCFNFPNITTFIDVKHKHGIAKYAINISWYGQDKVDYNKNISIKALTRVINKIKRMPMYLFN